MAGGPWIKRTAFYKNFTQNGATVYPWKQDKINEKEVQEVTFHKTEHWLIKTQYILVC